MTEHRINHGVLIAGFGGQGVVLAGKLLATAAMSEEFQVVWAPSYGPEMRGGPVHCTVIISSDRIGSPEVSLADTLMLMDRTSVTRFAGRARPGGLVVVNSSLIPDSLGQDDCQAIRIAANDIAEELGDQRIANVVMLGAFLSQRPVVAAANLEEAIRTVGQEAGSKPALIELNIRALGRGMELGRENSLSS